jgi:hypothetical protein
VRGVEPGVARVEALQDFAAHRPGSRRRCVLSTRVAGEGKRPAGRTWFVRVAMLLGLAFAAACGGARPLPVTLASPTAAPRAARVDFDASGRIERELAELRAIDATSSDTRPGRNARYAREIGLLSDLARCSDARKLAADIAVKGDAAAKGAAGKAVAECDRLERKPTPAELARMRAAFRSARSLEPTEPGRAEKLYAEAWADAPSVAAVLGLARSAKASGDAALAERSFERALGFVERDTGEKATVAVTPGIVRQKVSLVPVDVRGGAATFATGGLFLRQSLSTGAISVLAAVPPGFGVASATDRFALLASSDAPRTDPPRLLEIGIDDDLTATPLDALTGADDLAISRDGAIAAGRAGRVVSVVDRATGKLVAKTSLAPGDATLVGITSDHDVVLREPNLVCVLSPPTYAACRADAALHAAPTQYAAKPVVVGRRIAFLDGYSTMRVYDAHDRRGVRDIPGRFYRVVSLELSPDGATLISTSYTRGNYVWDLAKGTHVVVGSVDQYPPVWADDSKHLLIRRDVPGQSGSPDHHASLLYTLPAHTLAAAGSLPGEGRVFAFGKSGALWVAGTNVLSRVDLARGTVRTFPIEGSGVDMAVSPDESLVAVRLYGSDVAVYDPKGNSVASGGMVQGSMRFEGRRLVVAGGGSTEEVLDLDTKKVTTRPATVGAPTIPVATEAQSPDGKRTVKNAEDGPIRIEEASSHAVSTLDLAGDAFVLTTNGTSTVGGEEASALCRVGSVWLPLDTCRDRLLANPR